MISSVPVRLRQLAHRLVEARLRMDDADVREHRLGEHASDVAGCQLALERLDVVPLDDARRQVERHRRAEIALALDDAAVTQRCERLVDRAVVAPVEDEHLRPARDEAGKADREAVRVGRRDRELPPRQAEPPRQLLAHPQRVLARKHQRDPARGLLGDRTHDRLGRVPGHRAGVAEAEVDVLDAVDVAEASALCLARKNGKAARPADHPVHRHTGQERRVRAVRELRRAGVLALEALELAREQALRASVDVGHLPAAALVRWAGSQEEEAHHPASPRRSASATTRRSHR